MEKGPQRGMRGTRSKAQRGRLVLNKKRDSSAIGREEAMNINGGRNQR